jgi:ABC-2 type transport system ATP-binding protein
MTTPLAVPALAPKLQRAVLSCQGLTRRFGDLLAVDGVSLGIAAGETYGLLGPNGAGKTTTIRMICGLLRPDSGTVSIDGRHGRSARALIGYVPQDIALYPDLTARENLVFYGRLYGLRSRALARRVDEVLELIDLRDRRDDRVEDMSGGMKRRLNIGAGLVHSPTLLVLDEPTVGVDPQSRHAIMTSVRNFGAEGLAVLYTTHYMEEAERLCDRVGIIDRGHLVAEGTRRELVARVGEQDRLDLLVTGDIDALVKVCREVPDVRAADRTTDGVRLLAHDGNRLLPRLLAATAGVNAVVRSIEVHEPDLESVFLHLTGTALRE